jgi:hypothetical protein
MDKKPLIGVSMLAVVLLVMGSLSNVVGYQTVQTSQQNIIRERINQRELLLQTIVDIANNKEIQRIILKSQMSRGIFPTSEFPIVTKNQLKQMYLIGLILSKVISKSRIHSMVGKYQFSNQEIQKDITAVIEKNFSLKEEITKLSDSECGCKNENTADWHFPIICTILLTIEGVSDFYATFYIYILDAHILAALFLTIWYISLVIATGFHCYYK